MLVLLFSHILDYGGLVDRFKNESPDIGNVMFVLKGITEDILYSMFFEAPEENLVCVMILEKEELVYHVTLDIDFYNKHIGKFIDDAARKVINQIVISFVTKVEEIDWNDV